VPHYRPRHAMSARRTRAGAPVDIAAPGTARSARSGALYSSHSRRASSRHSRGGGSGSNRYGVDMDTVPRAAYNRLSAGGGDPRSWQARSLPELGSSRASSRRPSRGAELPQGRMPSTSFGASQSLRRRPRPGRPSAESLDLQRADPRRSHPLGKWTAHPRYRTAGGMWYERWQADQPHPSFDVDGDGTVSALDMYIAREFDKDGNGVLDKHETRQLRLRLAQKGIDDFSKLPHGQNMRRLNQSSDVHAGATLGSPKSPIPGDEQGFNPDSEAWHRKMNELKKATQAAQHHNSESIKACIAHGDLSAGAVAGMEIGSKGISALMGASWRDDDHHDVFEKGVGWIDKKAGPSELRNIHMADRTEGDDPIMAAYAEDMRQGGEFEMKDAVNASPEMNAAPSSSQLAATAGKPGKLAKDKCNIAGIRRLFEDMDVDGSGTLDKHELELLAASAGKKMTKRQIADAMRAMDKDSSGEVDFEEFKNWWVHGVMEPPKGSTVFRQISEKMEAKARNVRSLFRSFDENADGTVSQHEFRKGLSHLGIDVSNQEFDELMETLDEDNSDEIVRIWCAVCQMTMCWCSPLYLRTTGLQRVCQLGHHGGQVFRGTQRQRFLRPSHTERNSGEAAGGLQNLRVRICRHCAQWLLARLTRGCWFAWRSNGKVDTFWKSFKSNPSTVIGNMVAHGGTGSF
jgi:Ca2+-binding EF-hand superfamily protein